MSTHNHFLFLSLSMAMGEKTVGQILTWAAAFTLIATEVIEIMIGDDEL